MFFEKKIKRASLIELIDPFMEVYYNETDENNKKALLNNVLVNIENILKNIEVKEDKRFYTYGRRDFLKEEFTSKLNKSNIICNEDYLLDAFYNLSDYIKCDTWISSSSILNTNESPMDIIKKDDDYKSSGIICKQEKDILISMIHELLEAIKKDNEEEKFEGISEIYDVEVEKKICPYCNSTNIRKYLYGEPVSTYDETKYILGGCIVDFSKQYHCDECNNDFK